jgi:Ca-activated chloride channel family protein
MNPSIVRTSSEVRVSLANRVLHYEVEETFVNRGGGLGEADYLFPLPKGAAFRDLKLSINGELVAGETMNAGEARRIYEEIVRRQKDPALVEWMGHGLLRTRIFPINPGEKKRVVVRFDAVAEREGDAVRIDYFRGTQPGAAERRDREGRTESEGSVSFSLEYPTSEGWGHPYSPTHSLNVRDVQAKRRVEVNGGGREVTLLLPMRQPSTASITVLPHATGGREDGFALITVSPPKMRARATPRDVTLVIDVSGSMSGNKMVQAREAAKQVLEALSEGDRFRIVDFSTDVRTFRDNWAAVNAVNMREARRYLDALEAQGSTNIAGALDEALSSSSEASRMPVVLFITDGEPSVGERNPTALAERAARQRGRHRVFTFGLGADVNVQLVEQLALEGRGSAHFVRPNESVERTVGLVASRLSSPVATDVRIRAEGVRLEKILPAGPVDIFAGQDLVLLARYVGSGPGRIRFEGQSADGPITWTTAFAFPERERENAFVPRLWATQRVGWLSAEKRRNGANAEIDSEIRELGERYGIPTEFTSYFVKEPGMDIALQTGNRVGDLSGRLPGVVSAPAAVKTAAPTSAASAQRQRDAQFGAARIAQEQRAAASIQTLDVMAESAGGATSAVPHQRRGGHVFGLVDGVWTDVRVTAQMPRVKVKPYSAAYFKLVELVPELRELLSVGEKVVIAGRNVAVEVTDKGSEVLTEREIEMVRSNW